MKNEIPGRTIKRSGSDEYHWIRIPATNGTSKRMKGAFFQAGIQRVGMIETLEAVNYSFVTLPAMF